MKITGTNFQFFNLIYPDFITVKVFLLCIILLLKCFYFALSKQQRQKVHFICRFSVGPYFPYTLNPSHVPQYRTGAGDNDLKLYTA